MHRGSQEVIVFVRAHEQDWRRWDHPDIRRPLISLVGLTPEAEFEAGRPDRGVALRVRCAWDTTPQGVLLRPLAEFVKLTVDGTAVTAVLVEKKRPNREALDDQYHCVQLTALSPVGHAATATVRELTTGRDRTQTIEFVAEAARLSSAVARPEINTPQPPAPAPA